MATITPVIPSGTASLPMPLQTPGWPMASVPASNPIAGAPGSSPEPNAVDAALIQQALVQSGNTSNNAL